MEEEQENNKSKFSIKKAIVYITFTIASLFLVYLGFIYIRSAISGPDPVI